MDAGYFYAPFVGGPFGPSGPRGPVIIEGQPDCKMCKGCGSLDRISFIPCVCTPHFNSESAFIVIHGKRIGSKNFCDSKYPKEGRSNIWLDPTLLQHTMPDGTIYNILYRIMEPKISTPTL